MKQISRFALALILIALILATPVAFAAERLSWSGKDDTGGRYSFYNTAGDSWTITITEGGKSVSDKYTEVTRTEDFVELRDPADKDERARLYKDKLMFWSKSSGRWVEAAKGKWSN